jgi:uracil-DNA glycosylase family 4
MDGREQLRRYLEQRKESGEKDLVLDGLSVDEALKLLGAAAIPKSTRGAQKSAGRAAPLGGDWREVLRETGAAPDAPPAAPTDEKEATTPPKADPIDGDLPQGIVIGRSGRELFGGPMADMQSLDAVANAVAKCTRCPLYATALNPVPGSGNPNADLMVVGEAPGATEDEQGLPFVGAAGKLLTDILAAIQLRRDDVFICNVLKHRPPGNRNPLPEEVKACNPYLVRQIELVRPKVILALGTFAAQTLLETTLALGKLREQVHRYYGVPLIVTFHPAALLRNPSWKRPTWKDVQLARRILDSAITQS